MASSTWHGVRRDLYFFLFFYTFLSFAALIPIERGAVKTEHQMNETGVIERWAKEAEQRVVCMLCKERREIDDMTNVYTTTKLLIPCIL